MWGQSGYRQLTRRSGCTGPGGWVLGATIIELWGRGVQVKVDGTWQEGQCGGSSYGGSEAQWGRDPSAASWALQVWREYWGGGHISAGRSRSEAA